MGYRPHPQKPTKNHSLATARSFVGYRPHPQKRTRNHSLVPVKRHSHCSWATAHTRKSPPRITRSLPLARSARHSLATPSRQSRSVISRAKARSIARASGVLQGAGEDTTTPYCRAGCLPPAPVALLPRAWSAVCPYRRRFGQWLRHLPLVSSPAIPLHNLRRSQPPAPYRSQGRAVAAIAAFFPIRFAPP